MEHSEFVNKFNMSSNKNVITAGQANKISVLSKNSKNSYRKFEVNRMDSHSKNVRFSNTLRKPNQFSTRKVFWAKKRNKNGQIINKLVIALKINTASLKSNLATRMLDSDSSDDECELIGISQLEKSLKNVRNTMINVEYENNFIKKINLQKKLRHYKTLEKNLKETLKKVDVRKKELQKF